MRTWCSSPLAEERGGARSRLRGGARRRVVSILLSNGQRVDGAVRVYRPEGRDRLSDWTRQPETFRYVETGDATFIVNAAHIVEVSEVPEP